MFSLLAKLFAIALDWNALPGHKVKIKEAIPQISAPTKEKTFIGKITNINSVEEYGLINKSVYFSFDKVYANQVLSVGDIVLVRASRQEIYHAWVASFVELQKNVLLTCNSTQNKMNKITANKQENMFRIENIEQTVAECNGRHGKLKDGFEFLVSDGEIDFVPVVGDILSATVCYSDGRKKVQSWKPKEVKCVEGEVTACENDCGIINDEIIFFRSSCRRKVHLYVGQKVSAMIASSVQGLFKWRAFSLSTSSNEEVEDVSRKPCLSSREGVCITDPLSFENVYLGQENALDVTLQNDTLTALIFLGCYFQNKSSIFYLSKNFTSAQAIPESTCINMIIHCKSEVIGQHEDTLLFEFSSFIIKRNVTVNIVDPIQHILKPTAPFSFKKKSDSKMLDCESLVIIPGRKPYKPISRFMNKLPPSNIPKNLLKAVQNREDIQHIVPWLFQDLKMHNYVRKFRALLHLEEIQVRSDMKKFDLCEAVLQRKGEFLSLEVVGLAEGRPSLIIGDKAILVPPYSRSNFAFEGCIHEVHLNEVLLKFSDSFHDSYDGEMFDVRFELNRTNFKRLHQCVHHVSENHEYAIFPAYLKLKDSLVQVTSTTHLNSSKKRQKTELKPLVSKTVHWKNDKLNWKQKEAVLRILECRCRPLPYIIFGPPGTGKTVTLVEAVLQVYENIPDSKIIICTPSNSAADLVAQRILEKCMIDVSEMIRLNSYQRRVETIPEFIKPYCQDKDSVDYLTQYRIVISTCSTAGSLYTIGLCNDFFTHVFIDEAGQLMEPESAIALGFIDSQTNGQVVMAGDPQQLGPVLRSSYSITYGLQVSYLERLMNTALYARNEKEYGQFGGYNPLLITMLEESYRSHPDILRFPSDMFYFSQVICCFPSGTSNKLSNWDELPTKGFPIIFHGVKGEEFREENSPSWFNPTEVVQVTKYLQKLYDFGLNPDDVGIIAPYKKQVEKIRLLLSALSLDFCKIGSVEEFQGQERRSIIISTVRSSDQYVDCDILYNLGFISNPKRLNVAITRSQELLIVVGNPYVLSNDFYWHSFIRYCVVNGCYTGCELPLSFVQNKSSNNV
ncbi:RNA helicase Mov10l1-like [Stegodyphus dumicola]|uniref:RNA helicase Mov10l1-like n=1 Tax=Stegodyphus dumicola TaxID=202533 RepID=UPI0015A9809E|nr:RNA helicase Mov10l1-like [Stegodyphus dumicola]